jgi:hypothetical protein
MRRGFIDLTRLSKWLITQADLGSDAQLMPDPCAPRQRTAQPGALPVLPRPLAHGRRRRGSRENRGPKVDLPVPNLPPRSLQGLGSPRHPSSKSKIANRGHADAITTQSVWHHRQLDLSSANFVHGSIGLSMPSCLSGLHDYPTKGAQLCPSQSRLKPYKDW